MGCGGSSANDTAASGGGDADANTRALRKPIKPDWEELNKKLPRTRSAEDTEARKSLFNQWDPNGNGYLSLAEVDKGCREIGMTKLTNDLAPILMRAFTAAKAAATRLGGENDNQDYVQRAEFRLLLVYIYDYFEMYVAFDEIDTSDDRRVTIEEFKKAVPKLQSWGIQVDDVNASFAEIDKNGGGKVLFEEFTEWAINKHIDVDNKDNVE